MSNVTARMVQVYLYRRAGNGEWEFLLLRRSPDEALYPGLWQMVTGGMEADETAMQAARRELREETGVDVSDLHIVPFIATFYLASDDSIHHVPVFAAEAPAGTTIALSAEHDRCAWLCYEDAWKRLVFPGHREGLRILREYVLSA
jgi:8-oxo-dGTP pyrophosphatase MutT (NUDIX family)